MFGRQFGKIISRESMKRLTPYRIRRRDEGLTIEWEEGAPGVPYPARALRLACPCAECVEEMSGRPLLRPETVPADVTPRSIQLVGGYGLKIVWSDGHSTGIYTFEALRRGLGGAGTPA
jgi:ATP-binding protein involved in chromosome partitioning